MVQPALTPEEETARTLEEALLSANMPRIVPRPALDSHAPVLDSAADVLVVPVAQGGGGFELLHGSTVATNALLERRGARVVLVTNRGFEDVIEIGRQNRPQLYALVGLLPPLAALSAPGPWSGLHPLAPWAGAFAFGLAAGLARERSESIVVPIAFHWLGVGAACLALAA